VTVLYNKKNLFYYNIVACERYIACCTKERCNTKYVAKDKNQNYVILELNATPFL